MFTMQAEFEHYCKRTLFELHIAICEQCIIWTTCEIAS